MDDATLESYVGELERIFTGPFGAQFEPHDSVNEIVPRVFVGTAVHAKDADAIKKSGYTHIVNCISDKCKTSLEFYEELLGKGNVDFLPLTMQGNMDYNVTQHFEGVRKFLNAGYEQNNFTKLFIHCSTGMSRSVSICLSFLIQGKINLTLQDAACKVRVARFGAGPNTGFLKQLIQDAHRLNSLAPLGETPMPFDEDFLLGSGDEEDFKEELEENKLRMQQEREKEQKKKDRIKNMPLYIQDMRLMMLGPKMIEFEPENAYDEIIPGIYLGECEILKDKKKISGFTHIVNCNSQYYPIDDEHNRNHYQSNDANASEDNEDGHLIEYFNFPGDDDDGDEDIFDLDSVLEPCIEFINNAFEKNKHNEDDEDDDDDDNEDDEDEPKKIFDKKKAGKPSLVLICCITGTHLSAAILAGFLVRYREMLLYEAIRVMMEGRMGISINVNFLVKLWKLQNEKNEFEKSELEKTKEELKETKKKLEMANEEITRMKDDIKTLKKQIKDK